MKKNKVFAGALALAMGLGVVAPVAQSFANEDNQAANVQPKEAALDLSKVLLSARKLEKADGTLTAEDNKLVEAYNALAPEKKEEVKKAVLKALGENYELNGTDLKLKEGKTDDKPADFVKAFVGAVEKAVNDAKAEKPAEEVKENNETGFSTKEAADKAGQEALKAQEGQEDAKSAYKVTRGTNGKFYYELFNKVDEKPAEETPENKEKGYDSEAEAKKAAEDALKKDEINKSYSVSRGLDGKWYFVLSTEEKQKDPDKKPGNETPDKKDQEDPNKKPEVKDKDLEDAKVLAKSKIEALAHLSTSSKANFAKLIDQASTKATVDSIVEDAVKADKELVKEEDKKDNKDNKKPEQKGQTSANKVNKSNSNAKVTKKAVNKEKLNKAIVDAEILIKDEKGTETQRDRLQIAIDNARKSRDKADVTQSELDAQEKTIRDIMNEILGIKTETHEEKKAKDSVKTGVAGVAGVAGALALAAAGYVATNKRK